MHDPDSVEHLSVMTLWERWAVEGVLFIAPSLLRYEVTNAVYRSVRQGLAQATEAVNIIQSLEKLPIQYFDGVDLSVRAFEIARSLHLSAAYDAHYLALAQRERADLYTADKRLANAARPAFSFVRYVMDE